MPRKPKAGLPSYRLHKPSGNAIVTLSGKDYYIGQHGTKASKQRYDQLIAEWLANGRQVIPETGLTVSELILAYWRYAEAYYQNHEGDRTGELPPLKIALGVIRSLYGKLEVSEFSPLKLRAIQNEMINRGWGRKSINSHIGRIKRMVKWGVSMELVPEGVYSAIALVPGLREAGNRIHGARETEAVKPVSTDVFDATLEHLREPVADCLRIIRLTGARPGEIYSMTPADIDRSGPIWIYRPQRHKNKRRGKDRSIAIGPQAQLILAKYLGNKVPGRPVFERKWGGRWQPFNRQTIASRIRVACIKHKIPHWHPNQLRHLAATEIRERHGVEAASVILGHSQVTTTQIYAEKNLREALQIAAKMG